MRRLVRAFTPRAIALSIPCLVLLGGCNAAARRGGASDGGSCASGVCSNARRDLAAPDYPVSGNASSGDRPAQSLRNIPAYKGAPLPERLPRPEGLPTLSPAPSPLPAVRMAPVPGLNEDTIFLTVTGDTHPPAAPAVKPTAPTRLATAPPTLVSLSGHPFPVSAPKPAVPAGNVRPAPLVRMVRNRRITLDFEVEGVGPSGVSAIELWYTRDRQNWLKYEGAAQSGSVYVVEVDGEGRYGFTLVARNGLGFGKGRPQPGDVPQVLVEVDTTRPAVQLTGSKVLFLETGPALCVYWKAQDKNLDAHPIRLAYSQHADGPWHAIGSGLENWGSYLWKMPAGMPSQFYVRVEASDRAGNAATDQSKQPILMDGAQPRISVRGVY